MNRYILFFYIIVFSLSKAQNVEMLSNYDPYPGVQRHYADIWGYADEDGREYALIDISAVNGVAGTMIVDITEPTTPVHIVTIPAPASLWRDIKTYDHYAYIVNDTPYESSQVGASGLQIVDLSQLPDTAILVSTNKQYFNTSHNIFVFDHYLFAVATNHENLHILDISDPENPVSVSTYNESGDIHDIYVWEDRAVVASGYSHDYDLIDLSDMSNPRKISGSAPLPGVYGHAGWATEDKNYFLATDEFNERDITVWDISDENNWELVVPDFELPGISRMHNLFVQGNYAHCSYYNDGYVVLDISDPTKPFKIGQYDTYPNDDGNYSGAWGCYPYLPSGNTIISDTHTGLYVMKFTPGDIEPIVQINNQLEYLFEVQPVLLNVDILDDGEIIDANLFYRTVTNDGNSTSEWQLVEPSTENNGTYNFEIPAFDPVTVVEYYIGVKDDADNIKTVPSGGSGEEPAGNIPPANFFSYIITIPGIPIISSVFPDTSDITIERGNIVQFSVEAEDTSGLPLSYQWYLDDNLKSDEENFLLNSASFISGSELKVRVNVSNPSNSVNYEWNVLIASPTPVEDKYTAIDYNLAQNYPNPFNPSTNITYSIPEQSHVILKIFNVIGQEVATLVDEFKSPGKYEADFYAENLSGGIYFAYINAGNYTSTIKMTLIK